MTRTRTRRWCRGLPGVVGFGLVLLTLLMGFLVDCFGRVVAEARDTARKSASRNHIVNWSGARPLVSPEVTFSHVDSDGEEPLTDAR